MGLVLFYNISGIAMCVLAVLMFSVRYKGEKDEFRFNYVKRYLGVMFLLAGISMFVAKFDKGLTAGEFEVINILMLLFFFLICQGFLLSFLVLYASKYATRQTFNRIIFPILILFFVYGITYIYVGDQPVYSLTEFVDKLPFQPMLIMRCVIAIAVVVSVLYSVRLCHLARREYNVMILGYFSETDFARSIWLSNLLWLGETLAVWILLTYFYTTIVLEIVIGVMMIIVFAFYLKEFYVYGKRYERFRPALLSQESVAIEITEIKEGIKQDVENHRYVAMLENWKSRDDKPFTKKGLTIGDLSKDLSIPKYRISNYVNADNTNFCSWINDLRIEEAARMLKEEPSLSISEIADRTGFCDLPAFSRAFKKTKGISPSEYRNN